MKLLSISRFLFCWMIVSRVLGLLRDLLIAWIMGAGLACDMLSCVLRIPHLFRRLLSEGILSAQLTNEFVRMRPESAAAFSLYVRLNKQLFWLLLFFLFGFLLLAELVVEILAPSFSAIQVQQTASLFRIVAPYFLFTGLAALTMAFLHAHSIYWVSAITPALANIILILTLLGILFLHVEPLWPFVWAVSLSGLVQWFFQAWKVRRLKCAEQLKILDAGQAACETTKFTDLKDLGQAALGILASSGQHGCMLVAMIFLSHWGEGQMAAQFFAERILELPLGLIGVSLGLASLPVLSHLAAVHRMYHFQRTLVHALSWCWLLVLPAAFGLAVVGEELIHVLLCHGNFDAQALSRTTEVLLAYTTALPACVVSRVLLAACLALKGTGFAALSVCFAMLATSCFAALGLYPPWAVSFVLWIQTAVLWFWVGQHLPGLRLVFPKKALFAAVFAGLTSKVLILSWTFLVGSLGLIGLGSVCLGTVLAWYFLFTYLSRPDARRIHMLVCRKLRTSA